MPDVAIIGLDLAKRVFLSDHPKLSSACNLRDIS